jgi:hypothetical protein
LLHLLVLIFYGLKVLGDGFLILPDTFQLRDNLLPHQVDIDHGVKFPLIALNWIVLD